MKAHRTLYFVPAFALLTAWATPAAQACSVCMGDPNSRFADATNAAMFLLLGFLAVVLGLLSAFGFYLYRRSTAPTPPHLDFTSPSPAQPNEGIL